MVILEPLMEIKPSCLNSDNVLITDSVAVPTMEAKSSLEMAMLKCSSPLVLYLASNFNKESATLFLTVS